MKQTVWGGVRRILSFPRIVYNRVRLHQLSLKLSWTIPINIVGPGCCIVHEGPVIINPKASIGSYCRIMSSVTIGEKERGGKAPIIGDYVFIGDGAKILGDVAVPSLTCIGANAVVVSNIDSKGTYAGIPAKKVSEKDSRLQYNSQIVGYISENE